MAQTFRFQPGCCGCGCTSNHICVNINLCCGETLSGSTLTLTQGVTTIGTATTDSAGHACVTIPTSGTYTVTCSRSGYVSDVRTVVLGCGNYNLVVNLDFCVNGLVQGCNGNDLSYSHPVSGASVVIKLTTAGTTVYSTTTGADGRFCTHLPSPAPDSYTATVTASRYDTLVQVLSPGSHDPHANTGYTGPIVYWTNFYMQPTAGYTCCPTCTEPIPDTLHATLVIGGTTVAVTLVRSGLSAFWYGCSSATVTGITWTDAYGNCVETITSISVPFSVGFNCVDGGTFGPGTRGGLYVDYPAQEYNSFGPGDPIIYPTEFYYYCTGDSSCHSQSFDCSDQPPRIFQTLPSGCHTSAYGAFGIFQESFPVNSGGWATPNGSNATASCSPNLWTGTATDASGSPTIMSLYQWVHSITWTVSE
jgi:hypothetical protein